MAQHTDKTPRKKSHHSMGLGRPALRPRLSTNPENTSSAHHGPSDNKEGQQGSLPQVLGSASAVAQAPRHPSHILKVSICNIVQLLLVDLNYRVIGCQSYKDFQRFPGAIPDLELNHQITPDPGTALGSQQASKLQHSIN